MIITKEVNIRINHTNINYYKNLGYDIKTSDIIIVPVEKLSKGSHAIIKVSCDDCGKEHEYLYNRYLDFLEKNKYHKYFCYKCVIKSRDKTNLEKYGVKSTMQIKETIEKKRKTCLEKYGFDHPNKSEVIKNKIFDTNIKRYGNKYIFIGFRNKIVKTNIEKYGGVSSFCSKDIKRKCENTMLEKYGHKFSNQIKKIHKKIIENGLKTRIKTIKQKYSNILDIVGTNYTVKCDNGCNHSFEIDSFNFYQRIRYNTIICSICNPIDKHSSGKEINFIKFITDNYSGETISNYRILNGKEIDIFIPELKIGFEFNGLYWHSDEFKDNDYHKNKVDVAKLKGIKLLHVYEDDWFYKNDIIKNDILRLLKPLKKDKINIFETNQNISSLYVSNNNLYGYEKSGINICASNLDNDIISMISIKRIKGKFEIVRLTGDEYFDELFYYFIKKYKPNNVFGYVNKDWNIYNFFETNNFIIENESEPSFQYLFKTENKRYEMNILLEKQIPKVYNCGKIKYVLNF